MTADFFITFNSFFIQGSPFTYSKRTGKNYNHALLKNGVQK